MLRRLKLPITIERYGVCCGGVQYSLGILFEIALASISVALALRKGCAERFLLVLEAEFTMPLLVRFFKRPCLIFLAIFDMPAALFNIFDFLDDI
jgi:hypothetical protein